MAQKYVVVDAMHCIFVIILVIILSLLFLLLVQAVASNSLL